MALYAQELVLTIHSPSKLPLWLARSMRFLKVSKEGLKTNTP